MSDKKKYGSGPGPRPDEDERQRQEREFCDEVGRGLVCTLHEVVRGVSDAATGARSAFGTLGESMAAIENGCAPLLLYLAPFMRRPGRAAPPARAATPEDLTAYRARAVLRRVRKDPVQ